VAPAIRAFKNNIRVKEFCILKPYVFILLTLNLSYLIKWSC